MSGGPVVGTVTAGALGWIPGQGTKIPQDAWHGQKCKKVSEPEVHFVFLFYIKDYHNKLLGILFLYFLEILANN